APTAAHIHHASPLQYTRVARPASVHRTAREGDDYHHEVACLVPHTSTASTVERASTTLASSSARADRQSRSPRNIITHNTTTRFETSSSPVASFRAF